MELIQKLSSKLPLLERTWVLLIALSLITTGLTLFGQPNLLGSAAILLLAFFKSRMILSAYLELNNCPFWLRGLSVILFVFLVTVCLMLAVGDLF